LPGLALHRWQLHLALKLYRPISLRLHIALHVHPQTVTLQLQAVDAQATRGPVRRQVQIAKQITAIQAQLPHLHLTDLDRQRQAQGG